MQNSCNLIYVYTNVHSYEHFGVFAFVRERQRESVHSHVYVYVSKKIQICRKGVWKKLERMVFTKKQREKKVSPLEAREVFEDSTWQGPVLASLDYFLLQY